jgi:hypothetical protein
MSPERIFVNDVEQSGPSVLYCPSICLEGLKESIKNLTE